MINIPRSYIVTAAIAFFHLSCNNDTINTYNQGGSGGSGNITVHRVTDNPRSIISYSDLQNFTKGTAMKLRVNRNDFEVWEVAVIFDAVYTAGQERLILCHSESDFPVGAGDSGSPLLTSDGRIAGILCYGYFFNSRDFIARAIEDVIGIDTAAASMHGTSSVYNVIQPAAAVTGYHSQAASIYQTLGQLLDNGTPRNHPSPLPSNGLGKIDGNSVIPGSSIAVNYISGDYVNYYAIGTLSYFNNEKMYAFGHSYRSFLAAPVYLASTKAFITTNAESFKMSEASSELIGSCVKNSFNGILIKNNVTPLTTKVATSCTEGGKTLFTFQHTISNTPSFKYDLRMATDVSCYLIYQKLSELNKREDSVAATCQLHIATDQGNTNRTFTLTNSSIDWRIYEYILYSDSVRWSQNSKELKTFNLSVDLKY